MDIRIGEVIVKTRIILITSIAMSLCFTGFIVYTWQTFPEGGTRSDARVEMQHAQPMEKSFYETTFSFTKQKVDLTENDVIGGIIPHHLLAGDLIAEFFSNLENKHYDTVLLLGPNHFDAGQTEIITSAQNWETPYGVLPVDTALVNRLVDLPSVSVDETVMAHEHAIFSEVAFIKHTFPNTTFVPLILKANVNSTDVAQLAAVIDQITTDKKVLLLASVDFSHYKTSAEAQIDDRRSIEVIENSQWEEIYMIEADSPPSLYTLLKFNELRGGSFKLLNNSNSALLVGDESIESTTSYVTGYFVTQPK